MVGWMHAWLDGWMDGESVEEWVGWSIGGWIMVND